MTIIIYGTLRFFWYPKLGPRKLLNILILSHNTIVNDNAMHKTILQTNNVCRPIRCDPTIFRL